MSRFDKNVALPTTLTDLLEAKQTAERLMVNARKLNADAEQVLSQVGAYLFPLESKFKDSHDRAMRDLNRRLWRQAFDLTGFRQLMDTEAVNSFNRELDSSPPDFTENNIRSTFLSVSQEADALFRRGLVNVFRGLSLGYRTNASEPFRVGDKVICDYMVTNFHSPRLMVNYSESASNRLDDIDRVFKTLDDQKFTPRALEVAINAAWADGDDNTFEDDYFRIKGFKKGSMHIWFKRPDLLEKANELIAQHYGENVLAAA